MNPKAVKLLLLEDKRDDAQKISVALAASVQITHLEQWLSLDSLHAWDHFQVVLAAIPQTNSPLDVLERLQQSFKIPIIILCNTESEQETISKFPFRSDNVRGIFLKTSLHAPSLIQAIYDAIERHHLIAELALTKTKLELSELRFRNIINKNSDGIIIVDRQGFIRFVNPSAETLFGRSASQLLYTPFGFPLAPNETSELDIIRGNQNPAIAEMRLVETEWENETAYLASLRDITQRKISEEQVRLLSSAIQQTNDAVVITTIKTDLGEPKIIFTNPAFTVLTGYQADEVIEKHPSILQNSTTPQEAILHLYQFPITKTYFSGEIINRRKDDSIYYADWQIAPIYDENDQLRYFISVLRDITERHLAEAALRKSEETFRALFESASEGILIADNRGQIILVNKQIEALFGYSQSELIGQPLEILMPERFHSNHIYARETYAQTPHTRQMGTGLTLYAQRKDGSEFRVDISLSYVEAQEPLMIAFVQDITERLRTQQNLLETELLRVELSKERELLELKNRFISTITHEFRTPLAVIQTSSDLLRLHHEKLTEENREKYLNRIKIYIEHLNNMIEDVITLNRSQVDRIKVNPTVFEITPFCEEIIKIFELDKVSSKHQFELEVHPTCETVKLDRDLLYQILTHLFSNAIKYAPDGGNIKLTITHEQENYVFRLSDEGIGIPKDEHKRIFDAFHRARNVGAIAGTGLGLAIVKNCLDLQRGEVEVDSDENAGTTMIVRLPAPNDFGN